MSWHQTPRSTQPTTTGAVGVTPSAREMMDAHWDVQHLYGTEVDKYKDKTSPVDKAKVVVHEASRKYHIGQFENWKRRSDNDLAAGWGHPSSASGGSSSSSSGVTSTAVIGTSNQNSFVGPSVDSTTNSNNALFAYPDPQNILLTTIRPIIPNNNNTLSHQFLRISSPKGTTVVGTIRSHMKNG